MTSSVASMSPPPLLPLKYALIVAAPATKAPMSAGTLTTERWAVSSQGTTSRVRWIVDPNDPPWLTLTSNSYAVSPVEQVVQATTLTAPPCRIAGSVDKVTVMVSGDVAPSAAPPGTKDSALTAATVDTMATPALRAVRTGTHTASFLMFPSLVGDLSDQVKSDFGEDTSRGVTTTALSPTRSDRPRARIRL